MSFKLNAIKHVNQDTFYKTLIINAFISILLELDNFGGDMIGLGLGFGLGLVTDWSLKDSISSINAYMNSNILFR